MIIHALQTVLHLNKKYLSDVYNYRVYNNIFWIFLIQMDRANRVICISPFYFILLANSPRWRLRGFWSWLIRDPEDVIQWSPENSGINVVFDRSFFLYWIVVDIAVFFCSCDFITDISNYCQIFHLRNIKSWLTFHHNV